MVSPERTYGSRLPNGSWTGLLGLVVREVRAPSGRLRAWRYIFLDDTRRKKREICVDNMSYVSTDISKTFNHKNTKRRKYVILMCFTRYQNH